MVLLASLPDTEVWRCSMSRAAAGRSRARGPPATAHAPAAPRSPRRRRGRSRCRALGMAAWRRPTRAVGMIAHRTTEWLVTGAGYRRNRERAICSRTLRSPTSRLLESLPRAMRSLTERARRSRRQDTSVSLPRRWSSTPASCGRSAHVPVAWFGPHAGAASLTERVELQLGRLVGGRDARVTEELVASGLGHPGERIASRGRLRAMRRCL